MTLNIGRYIKSWTGYVESLRNHGLLNWMPNKAYIKLIYKVKTGEKLNLDSPVTYNEKLQWLKLYDCRPEYTMYSDKFAVREHIKKTIGKQYLIPLIGVYENVEDIKWDKLPKQFVLKCTHGSGFNIICKDKSNLDKKITKEKLRDWMNTNFYLRGREWPYKNIRPCIVCEKYMVDESGVELKDYKIFCFNGEPKIMLVDFNRFIKHKRNIYTIDWDFLKQVRINVKFPNDPTYKIPKPKKLDDMLQLARILSKDIPHVRIDLYSIKDRIYFGEMTFCNGGGYSKIKPESLNKSMGDWITLPKETPNNL